MTDNSNATTRAAQGANGSTLIEFPGVNRNRPAWRKELSERFREIQQRRAREADFDGEESPRRPAPGQAVPATEEKTSAARQAESAAKQLGLVPTPDGPEPNPIVAAALRRIERARANAQAQHVARHGSGRAQTAAARVVEEQPEQVAEAVAPPQPPPLVVVQPKQSPKAEPAPQPQGSEAAPAAAVAAPEAEAPAARKAATRPPAPPRAAGATEATEANDATGEPATTAAETFKVETVKKAEATRPRVEVSQPAAQAASRPAPQTAVASASAETEAGSRQPRHISGVLDEFWLERQGIELLPKVEEKELTYDDRAPRVKRVAAAAIDLLAVAGLCAPFAAAIELSIGNWRDQRVWGSMALIAGLVMFLYHTCSVALAGRTLGMKLLGLLAVDARKASVPTTGQCMRRAFAYMLSLATCGLGILYSLFDAEGRTAHDLLSGTVVVRK
ncbi:MAG TPA: RDD family protein [Pyrinomonadaceae bacterium]|jgi:uncharacterized RDD family membrane protein YckC